jgi:hypothetical protein
MKYVDAKSGLEVRARFKGYTETGVREAVIPPNVYYRLDNEATGTVVIDWTAIEPVVVMDQSGTAVADCYVVINIPGSVNVMESDTAKTEEKTLRVCAAKDMDRELSAPFTYRVRRAWGR